MSYILKDDAARLAKSSGTRGDTGNGNHIFTSQYTPRPTNNQAIEFCCNGCARRAKAYLKRFGVKIRLKKCSGTCKLPHIGVISKNPKGKDIQAILLAGGFSQPGMPHGKNGAFQMARGA